MNSFFRPKLNMISCPTRFQEMKNLRKELGAKPRLFIKRDDLTEVGLGGNKNRKLEYVMYEAVKSGADTIITYAGPQSNHSRQTLAYAKMLGMECHLIIDAEPQENHQGNLFIYDIFGAILHFEPDDDKILELCDKLEEDLKKAGKKPYIIPIGASTPLGTLGYIESTKEVAEQSKALGINVGHIFVATGSAGTQSGIEIGARLYMPGCRVHGVTVSRHRDEQAQKVAKLCNETAEFIGEDLKFNADELFIHDEYFGVKYAVPTEAGNEAIKVVGRTEAILLDPVYTGKAMSGMIDILKKGELDDAEAVVFVHTGGSPAIFNFTESFKF